MFTLILCITVLYTYLQAAQARNAISYYYYYLYNNKMNAHTLIGQSAMVYCASKHMEILRFFCIII